MSTITAPTPTEAKTINGLKVGESVELLFCGSKMLGNEPHTETFVFLGFTGESEDREAKFGDITGTGTWEAYRFNKRWVYGSSAEPLRINKRDQPPAPVPIPTANGCRWLCRGCSIF